MGRWNSLEVDNMFLYHFYSDYDCKKHADLQLDKLKWIKWSVQTF